MLMDWLQAAREYGLPLVILAGFSMAIFKGWLVPGGTHEDVKKQRDRALELVYDLAEGVKALASTTPEAGGKQR